MTGSGAPADQEAFRELLGQLPGQPPGARDELACRLVRAAPPEVVEAVVGQWAHATAAAQRDAALSLIAALPAGEGPARHLVVLLQDPVPAIRRGAVALLCRGARDRGTRLLLLGLLGDEDPAVRRAAVAALAAEPGPDVVEPFLERLAREDEAERALITGALRRLAGDPESRLAERLMPALANEDDRVREAAVTLLGRMPNAAAILRTFLVHSRGLAYWLRERAADSILRISSDIVEPLLLLMQDAEQDVRVGALQLAAGCRDPRIVPRAIEILLGNDDWWVRSLAAHALGNFPSPEVRRALVGRLDDPELRPTVLAVLGRVCDGGTSACVIPCLSDPDRGTRAAALEALAALGGQDVLAAVQAVASSDPDPVLRGKALSILESHRPATERHLRELAAVRGARRSPAAPGAAGAPELEMDDGRR